VQGERVTGWGAQIKDANGNVIYAPIKSGGSIIVGRNASLIVDGILNFGISLILGCNFIGSKTDGIQGPVTIAGCANCDQYFDGGAIWTDANALLTVTNSRFVPIKIFEFFFFLFSKILFNTYSKDFLTMLDMMVVP
jgi:hypothetical protein